LDPLSCKEDKRKPIGRFPLRLANKIRPMKSRAYLDIETMCLSRHYEDLTVIGIAFDKGRKYHRRMEKAKKHQFIIDD